MIDPYRPLDFCQSPLNDWMTATEKALGSKLFFWQKTYIETGYFRQYGETTAKILKQLSQYTAPPLDFTKRPASRMEEFYRIELKEIKAKLDAAGIPTRKVWFTREQKMLWEAEQLDNRRIEQMGYKATQMFCDDLERGHWKY